MTTQFNPKNVDRMIYKFKQYEALVKKYNDYAKLTNKEPVRRAHCKMGKAFRFTKEYERYARESWPNIHHLEVFQRVEPARMDLAEKCFKLKLIDSVLYDPDS